MSFVGAGATLPWVMVNGAANAGAAGIKPMQAPAAAVAPSLFLSGLGTNACAVGRGAAMHHRMDNNHIIEVYHDCDKAETDLRMRNAYSCGTRKSEQCRLSAS